MVRLGHSRRKRFPEIIISNQSGFPVSHRASLTTVSGDYVQGMTVKNQTMMLQCLFNFLTPCIVAEFSRITFVWLGDMARLLGLGVELPSCPFAKMLNPDRAMERR